jgi:sugar lactone lactonase YvrE
MSCRRRIILFVRIAWVGLLVSLVSMGCGSSGPTAGDERGACFPNSTCNAGLTCLSNVCVRAPSGTAGMAGGGGNAGASGGTTGSGQAGVGGAGGALSDAAALDSPGASGSGGSQAGSDAAAGSGSSSDASGDVALGIDGGDDSHTDANYRTDVALVNRRLCPPGPFPAPNITAVGAGISVCGPGIVLKYGNVSGPVWVPGQNAFYFSSYPSNAGPTTTTGDIIKYVPGGACEIAFPNVGTTGLAISPDGRLIGASYKTRAINEYDLGDGHPTTIATMSSLGLKVDVPLDVVVRDTGEIYFSNRNGMGGSPVIGAGIFRIDALGNAQRGDGECCSFTETGMGGIALSPAGDKLYAHAGGTFDIDAQGNLINFNHNGIVAERSAGGTAVDCAGNIYLLGLGKIVNPALQFVGSVSGTDLAFGGADGKTVLWLGESTVFLATSDIPGMP